MISKKLQTIYFLSIPVFVIHGLEEFITGFYSADPYFKSIGQDNQFSFLLFQIVWWSLLISGAVLIKIKKMPFILMLLFGFVFAFEFEHLYHAVLLKGYYPGLVSGFLLLYLGFLYWQARWRSASPTRPPLRLFGSSSGPCAWCSGNRCSGGYCRSASILFCPLR